MWRKVSWFTAQSIVHTGPSQSWSSFRTSSAIVTTFNCHRFRSELASILPFFFLKLSLSWCHNISLLVSTISSRSGHAFRKYPNLSLFKTMPLLYFVFLRAIILWNKLPLETRCRLLSIVLKEVCLYIFRFSLYPPPHHLSFFVLSSPAPHQTEE